MFDLLVASTRLVLETGLRPGAVGIRDGAIAAILAPGTPADARQRMDVGDRLVFPGLVDCHVHFREPGMAEKEGFANGTRAAIAGGVTTVLVMPTDRPVTFTAEDFAAKRALAEGQCHADFGLQAAVGRDLSHLPALAALGAVSFEMFLADANPALRLDDGMAILAALEAIGETGRLAGITPGEHSIVETLTADLRAAGAIAPRDFPRARPPVAEAMGVARAAAASVQIPSTAVLFRQLSSRAAVDILRRFRRLRADLHAEVNPHHLFLTESALDRHGPFAVVSPPLRRDADVSALWSALSDGTIGLISTDHAPHLPHEKARGLADIWETPLGLPGLQTMLHLLLSAAASGRCTYSDIATWCAQTPARLFGLYPRKGCIAPGAHADLVIVDPDRVGVIDDAAQLSRAGRTPFAGLSDGGSIDLVLLRGNIVYRDGLILGEPTGRFLRPD
jgi:dihydroorotase